jgi:hypothetical protein
LVVGMMAGKERCQVVLAKNVRVLWRRGRLQRIPSTGSDASCSATAGTNRAQWHRRAAPLRVKRPT